MRRAAKIDRNQPEIVKALRGIGCTVAITSAVGQGFPDLVVAKARRNWLLEVKDGNLPPSARELTPDQLIFHTSWVGQIDVVTSAAEAVALVQAEITLPPVLDAPHPASSGNTATAAPGPSTAGAPPSTEQAFPASAPASPAPLR
jgi:hypothetical protein